MNDEAGTLLGIVYKYWDQFMVGAAIVAAFLQMRFKSQDHARRIEKLEVDQGIISTRLEGKIDDVHGKLEKLMFFLMEKK